jgi:TRAP-type C4-dicarboxylate transport system permease small subunit
VKAGDGPALAFWIGILPSRVLGVVSCALLFFMMLLTFVDVTGRYLFSSPLPAAYEIIAFTMPAIIFCALPTVNLSAGHVTIDLLDNFVPAGWKRRQSLCINVISAGVMGFIAWRLGQRSYDHWRFGEVTDELYLPLWPFSGGAAVLSVVAALAFVAAVAGSLSGRQDPSRTIGT